MAKVPPDIGGEAGVGGGEYVVQRSPATALLKI
jgi:hypothetical protein